MKTKTLLTLGAIGGGLYYAKKQGWLDALIAKFQGGAGAIARRVSVSAAEMGPAPSAVKSGSSEQESEQESEQGSGEEDSGQTPEGGGAGGGGSGGGGGNSGGGGDSVSAQGNKAGAAAGAPAAPSAVGIPLLTPGRVPRPSTLQIGMLARVPMRTLTPAVRARALQALTRSTIAAHRSAPMAIRMASAPSSVSVSMPRPGIVAARAAFPMLSPAQRPTAAFQSALAQGTQRIMAPISGRSPAPISMPGLRTNLVARSTPMAPVIAVSRIVPAAPRIAPAPVTRPAPVITRPAPAPSSVRSAPVIVRSAPAVIRAAAPAVRVSVPLRIAPPVRR